MLICCRHDPKDYIIIVYDKNDLKPEKYLYRINRSDGRDILVDYKSELNNKEIAIKMLYQRFVSDEEIEQLKQLIVKNCDIEYDKMEISCDVAFNDKIVIIFVWNKGDDFKPRYQFGFDDNGFKLNSWEISPTPGKKRY